MATRFTRRLMTAASALVVAVSALAAPASAATTVKLTQGQKIITSDGSECSVGYVEPTRGWTSAHCGLDGSQVYTGSGQHVGTLRWFAPSGAAGHDLAYVQFAGGTYSGGNPLTGDGMAPPPGQGVTVCMEGRYAGRHCGTTVRGPGVYPGMHYAAGFSLAPGDSGSAVSQEGRPGVVGIYQGITQANRNGRKLVFSNYARMPFANELARLPHQGFVPRRPDRDPGNLMRLVQERGEAFSSTSSKGPEGVKGLAAHFGLSL